MAVDRSSRTRLLIGRSQHFLNRPPEVQTSRRLGFCLLRGSRRKLSIDGGPGDGVDVDGNLSSYMAVGVLRLQGLGVEERRGWMFRGMCADIFRAQDDRGGWAKHVLCGLGFESRESDSAWLQSGFRP